MNMHWWTFVSVLLNVGGLKWITEKVFELNI